MKKICLNCMKEMGEYDVCSHCGWVETTEPLEPFELTPGTRLNDRYIVGMASAIGGFGILYHGYDTVLNIHVAIKEFYPQGIVNRAPGNSDLIVFSGSKKNIYNIQLKRFLEEARIQAKFSQDPNFVKVIDFFEANKTAYIVMEFLEGTSLKDYLKQKDVLDEDEAIKIITPVLDALTMMHKENIVHRDVNPNNIFITNSGQTKLLDFGSARLSNFEIEKDLTVIVTPGYAPSEQYKKEEKQGPFTDEYAIAATLYRMLTGKVPEESTDRVVNDELVAPTEINNKISKGVESVILRGMANSPKLRFKTIEEFKNALLKNQVVKLPEEVARQRKIARISIICLVVLLLAGVIGRVVYKSQNVDKAIIDASEIGEASVKVALLNEEGFDNSVYDEIIKTFNDEYSTIKVSYDLIEKDEYESALKSGDYNIYRRDITTLDNNADLDDLFDSLDLNAYGILKENKDILLEEKMIPTGYELPVLYLNRYLTQDLAEIDLSGKSFSEFYTLKDSINGLSGFRYAYLSNKQVAQVLLSQGKDAEAYSSDLDDTLKLIKELNGSTNEDEALNLFGNNKLLAYLGSSNDYRTIQASNGGNYLIVSPFVNNGIVATYKQTWSVIDVDEKSNKASMLFLSFLLSDVSQNYLYLQNDYGLPINETTLKNYSDEFDFVKENVKKITIKENYEELSQEILASYK